MGSFSIFQWLIVIGIFFLIYKAFSQGGEISSNGKMICPHCGTRGEPQMITKGSMGIEIILWLCFIVPGLIYSIWRMSTKYPACPACEEPGMIGVNTPNGNLAVYSTSNLSSVPRPEVIISSAMGDDFKKCPYCAEDIKFEAIKCKHCGSNLAM